MFILSPDKKTLTNEQGDGYFIQPVEDEHAIACHANKARVFVGTEYECLERMAHLAFVLKARRWHRSAVLVEFLGNSMLNVILYRLDDLKSDDAALDALARTADVLSRHLDCAKEIEQFAAEMERKYDPS